LTVEFNCPHCTKALRTSDDKAGRLVKCPECGNTITVPQAQAVRSDPFPQAKAVAGGTFQPGPRPPSTPIYLDAGEVISTSWAIFNSQMGMLIGAFVIVFLLVGAVALPANVIQIGLDNNHFGRNPNPIIGLVLFVLWFPASVFHVYMMAGLTLFLLKIARGQRAEFRDLFRGGRYLLRAYGSSLLYGLMLTFGLMLLVVPGIILALMFWPYLFVLVDTDAPGMECLSRAKEITRHTWGTVFLLWLTSFGLYILGALACVVGLLFAIPLILLLFAVAYCRMTGQPTVSV